MTFGYMGKILKVDLTNRRIDMEECDDAYFRCYMGCRAIGYDYLLREVPPRIDSFDPRNLLVFATGVMTGAPIPAACRFAVLGKSPLTEIAAESETGGFFGPELKKAGFDAVVISGRADKPVWIWLNDGKAEIRDATDLAQLDTKEVEDAIRAEVGSRKTRVAQTGPAGMNRVLYANITNNLAHFNGRNGLGALMGAKNLRAVAALGSEKISWADVDSLREVARKYGKITAELPISKSLHEYGTTLFAEALSKAGALPVNNFRRSSLDDTTPISPETYNRTLLKERKGCYACPIRCKRVVAFEHPKYGVDSSYGGPEYEAISALGTNLNITDLKAIAKANEICNKYCMDTISAGMTIAFACECFEKGFISESDTDGIRLRFGDPDMVIDLLSKIVKREGFGDHLANGIARLAADWGVSDEPFNLSTGGQELPMHDPRSKVMVGLGYAVSTHGADHMNAPHDTLFTDTDSFQMKSVRPLGIDKPMTPMQLSSEGIDTYVKLDEVYKIMDTLGLCVFGFAPRGSMPLDTLVNCLQACTSWDVTLDEVVSAAKRGNLMGRAYNYRETAHPKQAMLPGRLFEPKPDGPHSGENVFTPDEFKQAVRRFYELSDCDPETRRPNSDALKKYGLTWVDDLLETQKPG